MKDTFQEDTKTNDKTYLDASVLLDKFDKISSQFNVDFIVSVSLEVDEVPEKYRSKGRLRMEYICTVTGRVSVYSTRFFTVMMVSLMPV